MLKYRYPIFISMVLPLTAAIACDRLPLSLGQGIDALSDPTGGGDGPRGLGGATSGGVGGGSATGDDCYTTFLFCNQSGEDRGTCRDALARCEEEPVGGGGAGGYSATGDGCETRYTSCLESGERVEVCRDNLVSCDEATSGLGGYAAGGFSNGAGGASGPIGRAGSGAGGSSPTGDGADCETEYSSCLESEEEVETCRDELVRCVDTGGSVGGAFSLGGRAAY